MIFFLAYSFHYSNGSFCSCSIPCWCSVFHSLSPPSHIIQLQHIVIYWEDQKWGKNRFFQLISVWVCLALHIVVNIKARYSWSTDEKSSVADRWVKYKFTYLSDHWRPFLGLQFSTFIRFFTHQPIQVVQGFRRNHQTLGWRIVVFPSLQPLSWWIQSLLGAERGEVESWGSGRCSRSCIEQEEVKSCNLPCFFNGYTPMFLCLNLINCCNVIYFLLCPYSDLVSFCL